MRLNYFFGVARLLEETGLRHVGFWIVGCCVLYSPLVDIFLLGEREIVLI